MAAGVIRFTPATLLSRRVPERLHEKRCGLEKTALITHGTAFEDVKDSA